MEEKDGASTRSAPVMDRGTPFDAMVPNQKAMFVLKVVLCAISFGFIFPNVMSS
jgi:hypothetical protein